MENARLQNLQKYHRSRVGLGDGSGLVVRLQFEQAGLDAISAP
jgi:hypothetical protein